MSTDSDKRIQAGYELVESLSKSFRPKEGNRRPSPLPSEVEYAIKRLVRGLSSSTEAARQGFASCLAEVLAVRPDVPLSLVHEHMLTSTDVTGSVRGQDERDMLLGRLFTCLAVVRSGRLNVNIKEWDPIGMKLLETAIGIFRKRKVLRSLAAEAIVAMLECLPPQRFLDSLDLLTELGESLGAKDTTKHSDEGVREEVDVDALNPDQLGLALVLQDYLRQHGIRKEKGLEGRLPRWLLSSKRILKCKRIHKLIEPLKASSSAFPQVHPLWDRLLDRLLPSPGGSDGAGGSCEDEEGDDHGASFQALWTLMVDEVLACGTHERKALALMLLQRVAGRASATQLPICLSPNVLKILLMSLSTAGTADEILRPLAKQTLDALVATGEAAPEKRLLIACALLTRCDVNFDQKTGTSVLQDLVGALSTSELLLFVRHVVKAYHDAEAPSIAALSPAKREDCKSKEGVDGSGEMDESDAASTILSQKLWAVDALYALSRMPAVAKPGGEGVVVKVLRLLFSLAYFDIEGVSRGDKKTGASERVKKGGRRAGKSDKGETKVASWELVRGFVPEEVRRAAAARAHGLLAELGKGDMLPSQVAGAGTGALAWLWETHKIWRDLEAEGVELVIPLEAGPREARDEMLGLTEEILARIKKETGSRTASKTDEAFAILIMQVGLYQLNTEPGGGQEDFLGDLCRCYKDLAGTTKDSRSQRRDVKGGVDAMAVLADLCVGVLSTSLAGVPVRNLRDNVRKAWGVVCASSPITRPALEVLLGVVCSTSGFEDDEINGVTGDNGSDSESSDGSDDDSGENDAALAALDKVLSSTGMATSGDATDEGGPDDSESEEEEQEVVVDGSDPEAFRRLLGGDDENQGHLDHMLALRQASHQGGKESRTEAERQALQHRLRTLDLLEVVASKQPHAGLLLLSVEPCLTALRKLQAQAGPGRPAELLNLSHRLSDFLNKRLAKTRPRLFPVAKGGGGMADEEVEALTRVLVGELRRAPTKDRANTVLTCLNVCTRATLFASTSMNAPPPAWLVDLYRGALREYMTTRTSLTATPFEQLVARFPSPACLTLLQPLKTYVVEVSKAFRQAEALRLVALLLAQRRVFGADAKQVMQREISGLLDALRRVATEQSGDVNSKHLKPLVECCQTVATVIQEDNGLSRSLPPTQSKEKKNKGAKKEAAKEVAMAEAASELGRSLIELQKKTSSVGLRMSCLNVARQLGVSSADVGEPVKQAQVRGGKNHQKDKGKKRPRDNEFREIAEAKAGRGGGKDANHSVGKDSQGDAAQQKKPNHHPKREKLKQ